LTDAKKNITRSRRFEYGIYQILDQFLGKKRVARFLGGRRNAFSANLLIALKNTGEGKAIPIERRKDLSIEEFNNHYRKRGIPVVMEGVANNWDCVKNWSFEYFKKLHGNDIIALTGYQLKDIYETTTLGEVIDNIRSGGSKYYRFYPLLVRHPEHIKDFDYKWLLERKNPLTWFESWQVFMGGKDTVTNIHSENQCNLYVQAVGEKKWVLYPNYYTMVLDPNPVRNVYRNPGTKSEKGPFDPFAPDYTNYPEYQYIDRYETILKPGDVLFNPCFSWHTVKNNSDSIGVGYRWVTPLYAFKLSPLYAFLDLCAMHPPFWKAYKLYIEDTNQVRLAEAGKLESYLKEKSEKEKAQAT
jgi:hypothetical protein